MTITEFRLRHLDAFVDLFVQVLRLCGRAGLLELEQVSLYGTKVQANASKHKAMSIAHLDTACNTKSARPFVISANQLPCHHPPEGVRAAVAV